MGRARLSEHQPQDDPVSLVCGDRSILAEHSLPRRGSIVCGGGEQPLRRRSYTRCPGFELPESMDGGTVSNRDFAWPSCRSSVILYRQSRQERRVTYPAMQQVRVEAASSRLWLDRHRTVRIRLPFTNSMATIGRTSRRTRLSSTRSPSSEN